MAGLRSEKWSFVRSGEGYLNQGFLFIPLSDEDKYSGDAFGFLFGLGFEAKANESLTVYGSYTYVPSLRGEFSRNNRSLYFSNQNGTGFTFISNIDTDAKYLVNGSAIDFGLRFPLKLRNANINSGGLELFLGFHHSVYDVSLPEWTPQTNLSGTSPGSINYTFVTENTDRFIYGRKDRREFFAIRAGIRFQVTSPN